MANYDTLKTAVADVIKTNGNKEITGALLQQTLLAMINSLGVGYQFVGFATPATNPGTPDQNVFFIAQQPGLYSNFNGINVWPGEIAILKYNGSWGRLAKLTSVVRLAKIGSAGSPTDLSVGDAYYPGGSNIIRVTAISGGSVTGYETYLADTNTLYIVNDKFYKYDGTTLVDITTTISVDMLRDCFGDPLAKITVSGQDYYVKNICFSESYGLKQGYQLGGVWDGNTERVSTQIINAINENVRVMTTGDINIAGITKLNADLSYNTYDNSMAGTQSYELQSGFYYSIVFRKGNGNEEITPDDVAPYVFIGNRLEIKELKESIYNILDVILPITQTGVWYLGTQTGQPLSTTDLLTSTVAKHTVAVGDVIQYTGTGGASGRAWYILDAYENVIALASNNFSGTEKIIMPTNAAYFLGQSSAAAVSVTKLGVIGEMNDLLNTLNDNVSQVNKQTKYDSFKAKTAFLWNKLARLINTETGFVNIGFIGDSWTQGTENIIGGVNQGDFQGYVRPLTKMLQEKYGFGGLGWLDFSRDSGAYKMFGCAEMYEHWTYQFSGSVTGLDGNVSGQAANCLGICCAHTIFSNGSGLTLTFQPGYLDKFKLRYYKNAHFTVSINGGAATEITADSVNGWQETTFGTTGTDITSVVISVLADDTIIFGMDCFFGTHGVRCHKIGNRSISAAAYLAMNATQWEQGIQLLELDWCSVMLAINDLGGSTDPSTMDAIVTNISNLIDRAKIARTVNDLVVCDFNVLGIENIESATWTGLAMLAEKERQMALANNYGWANSALPVGTDKDAFTYMGTFSDQIHLNVFGSYAYAKHIFNTLFAF